MSAGNTSLDLSFTPKSYFWPLNLETHLRATVRGELRRHELERYIASGLLADAPEIFVRDVLTHEERTRLGRIHPILMGGEYLAARAASEVEIARISIRSTTGDVTCIYARQFANRIHYRVVDEYDGETLTGPRTRTSIRPLPLGALGEFFLQAWPLLDVVALNFSGGDMEQALKFAHGSSAFYPDFDDYVDEQVSEWVQNEERERDDTV